MISISTEGIMNYLAMGLSRHIHQSIMMATEQLSDGISILQRVFSGVAPDNSVSYMMSSTTAALAQGDYSQAH